MRKVVLLLTVVAVWFGLSAAQDAPERSDLNIVVVAHGGANNPWWVKPYNAALAAGEDMGVNVEYLAPDTYDIPLMSQLIDGAVAQSPDGLIISLPDVAGLSDSLQGAVDAGIPVFTINSGADDFEALGALRHFGQPESLAGQGAGEFMAEQGGTSAVCINHEVGNNALDERCAGFAEGFGGDVETLAVTQDPSEVANAVTAFFQSNPDVDTILALGPQGSEPALQALQEAGLAGTVNFGSFDPSPITLQAVIDGEMLFLVDQQPYLQGYLPVVFMTQFLQYGVLPSNKIIATGPGFVTADNAEQVIALSAQGIR